MMNGKELAAEFRKMNDALKAAYYSDPVACGTYGYSGTRGTWKWDAEHNTWAQEEVPPVNEIYAAPEAPKLTPEAEQNRLWDLLKQAAGG